MMEGKKNLMHYLRDSPDTGNCRNQISTLLMGGNEREDVASRETTH